MYRGQPEISDNITIIIGDRFSKIKVILPISIFLYLKTTEAHQLIRNFY